MIDIEFITQRIREFETERLKLRERKEKLSELEPSYSRAEWQRQRIELSRDSYEQFRQIVDLMESIDFATLPNELLQLYLDVDGVIAAIILEHANRIYLLSDNLKELRKCH